jgi:predicted DNA-binding transcriptional regulator AlpA
MTKEGDAFAYPPRGLSRVEAARYVGVGATLFDELIAEGKMPKPKQLHNRFVWDRVELDLAFSSMPEKNSKVQEALQRARARRQR